MRAYFADAQGRLQVVLKPENNEERLLLREFIAQIDARGVVMHGAGYDSLDGAASMNFGPPSTKRCGRPAEECAAGAPTKEKP